MFVDINNVYVISKSWEFEFVYVYVVFNGSCIIIIVFEFFLIIIKMFLSNIIIKLVM